jgi:hypothetical protein
MRSELPLKKLRTDLIQMPDIFVVRTDIAYIIADFLLQEARDDHQVFKFSFDWRNFCNTNKTHFNTWKKQTQIINLQPLYSNKFSKSSEFRQRMVENAQEQLVLNFASYGAYGRSEDLACCNRVSGIVAFKYAFSGFPCFPLDYLSLTDCDIKQANSNCLPIRKFYCKGPIFNDLPVADVSKLNITEEASFDDVELTNYHHLAHLQLLSISECDSITDVSSFKNIRKLKFHRCTSLVDVHGLGNVYDLTITHCRLVIDS